MRHYVVLVRVLVVILMATLVNGCSGSKTEPGSLSLSKVFVPGPVTDQDGNVYATVRIGTQTWLASDLRVTHLNDGGPIPRIVEAGAWRAATAAAYATLPDTTMFASGYYNWPAVNTGKLCPTGYRVPTDADWSALIAFAGGSSIAGQSLKSAQTWTGDSGADRSSRNASGYGGQASGYRDRDGAFLGQGSSASWWSSSTPLGTFTVHAGDSSVVEMATTPAAGLAVRCIVN